MKSSKKSRAKKDDLSEIIQHADVPKLHQFVKDYAVKHPEFKKELLLLFGPQKASGTKKDYIKIIEHAFQNNAPEPERDYYNEWYDEGYDSSGVADDLEPLLKKADFYMKNGNYEAAVVICCTLIETIPDEWEEEYDYHGDVQVIYDGAVDKLEEMLKKKRLSAEQVKALFDWYNGEQKEGKHRDMGLNNSLDNLQEYFTGTPEMLRQILKNMDERLKAAKYTYEKQSAALDKIRLLEKVKMKAEAEKAIMQYLRFPEVRMLRVDDLVRNKKYNEAIDLVNEGIKKAGRHGYSVTVTEWKDRLLDIYLLQQDAVHILATAEELFYNGNDLKKYYGLLKKHTPAKEWPAMLERLLAGTTDKKWMHVNQFKADMLIEHKMWDRLFDLCKKTGTESLEKYEKYLKPFYAKELLDAYGRYVEKQALQAHPDAYGNVARVLRKMKKFEGGRDVVDQLLVKYRVQYKNRPKMMEALKGI